MRSEFITANSGYDTITDFSIDDKLIVDLSFKVETMYDLKQVARQEGDNTILELYDNNIIKLNNFSIEDLSQRNLIAAEIYY